MTQLSNYAANLSKACGEYVADYNISFVLILAKSFRIISEYFFIDVELSKITLISTALKYFLS